MSCAYGVNMLFKLAKGLSVELIADALEVTVEEIKECISKMKN